MILLIVVVSSGCSIKHPVAKDYNQYLLNNDNQSTLPKTELETEYFLDRQTKNHRYEFRAATVGYANLWIVEFGKILDETLKANYVQQAFGKMEQVSEQSGKEGNLVLFTLKKYEFNNFQAHVSLDISFLNGNKKFNKIYHTDGKSQGAKMFFGGVFAMKNAIQQSTKLAIDDILREFIQDINANYVKDAQQQIQVSQQPVKKTEPIPSKPKKRTPYPEGNRLPPGVTIIGQ